MCLLSRDRIYLLHGMLNRYYYYDFTAVIFITQAYTVTTVFIICDLIKGLYYTNSLMGCISLSNRKYLIRWLFTGPANIYHTVSLQRETKHGL